MRFDSNKTIVIIKTIKYYNHCKKLYHIDDECKKLHFKLIIQNNRRNKIGKRIRNEIEKQFAFKFNENNNVSKSIYFVFMIVSVDVFSELRKLAKF